MTTTYYITADGRIVNNHDITRSYKQTDETIPFPTFREAWLAGCGGRRAQVSVTILLSQGRRGRPHLCSMSGTAAAWREPRTRYTR